MVPVAGTSLAPPSMSLDELEKRLRAHLQQRQQLSARLITEIQAVDALRDDLLRRLAEVDPQAAHALGDQASAIRSLARARMSVSRHLHDALAEFPRGLSLPQLVEVVRRERPDLSESSINAALQRALARETVLHEGERGARRYFLGKPRRGDEESTEG